MSPIREPYDCERLEDQCKATKRNGSDGCLNCRYVHGHPGPHKTCYNDGSTWTEPFNCPPPDMSGYRYVGDYKR